MARLRKLLRGGDLFDGLAYAMWAAVLIALVHYM
jgi:hypothetical protein